MLFFYKSEGPKSFWMPDTYFNLDIIFLNKDFLVVDIVKNIQHHPGRAPNPPIARTPSVNCRHVLEIRADSPLSSKIKLGTQFKWMSEKSPAEIESGIPL